MRRSGLAALMLGSALFFVSGAASLMYQVAWFRWLRLALGNTVQAATLTVAIFMAGLGLGAYVAGRPSRPGRDPLRAFARLEIWIGVCAVVLGMILPRLDRVIAGMGAMGVPFVRFALCGLLLLLPTFLMGATLPRLCQALRGREGDIGWRVGWLYAMNTLGAVAGVLCAGFWLVPALGLWRTNLLGAALDVAVGLLAFAMAWRCPAVSTAFAPANLRPADVGTETPDPLASPRSDRGVLIAVAVSGFLALAFEIVAFRLLILVFGSTTYSFSAMLAVYLCGIGVGAAVFGAAGRRSRDALWWFALTEIVMAVFAIWALARYRDVCIQFLSLLDRYSLRWEGLLAAKFAVAGFFMLIPTFCFGADVPSTVWRLGRRPGADPGTVAGRVYLWNTVGSVLGALCGGLILLPRLGLVGSWLFLAFGSAALGVGIMLCLVRDLRSRRIFMAVISVLALALVWRPARMRLPDQRLLSSGPYFAPWSYIGPDGPRLDEQLDALEVLYFHEGVAATVSVLRHQTRQLRYVSDGKIEADSSMRSMTLQRLQGHVPLLLHPAPRRVLNIGLGAGVTLGAITRHDVEQIEVAEIEPGARGVAEAFRSYNQSVLDDARIRWIWNDGRNHLLMDREGYDVITADPFEPVHAAAANLYTYEYFCLIHGRLRPGGVAAQYLPLYEMNETDYLSIAASFLRAFPATLLFYTGDDTILIGFRDGIALDYDAIHERFQSPLVRSSFAELGFDDVETVLALLVGDLRHHADWLADWRLNSDDRSHVEFSAPRHTLQPMLSLNHAAVERLFSDRPEALLAGIPDGIAQRLSRKRAALRLALRANAELGREEVREGLARLREAHDRAPEQPVIRHRLADVLVQVSLFALRDRKTREARTFLTELLELRPDDFQGLFHGARLAAAAGDLAEADALAQRGLARYPRSDLMTAAAALVAAQTGDREAAALTVVRAVALNPGRRSTWELVRDVAERLGDDALAEQARAALSP